jgi:hypothetical protein
MPTKIYCELTIHRLYMHAEINWKTFIVRGVVQDGEGTVPGQASRWAATKTTNTRPTGDEIRREKREGKRGVMEREG